MYDSFCRTAINKLLNYKTVVYVQKYFGVYLPAIDDGLQ